MLRGPPRSTRTSTPFPTSIASDLLALAILQVHQLLDHGEDVLAAQRRHRVLGVEPKAHVELDAAHRRQVVTLGVEEQAAEQGFGGFARRRFAGADRKSTRLNSSH